MALKKLLVLDVNGLLIDTYFHKEPLPEESPDAKVGNFYVYKRPFCEEFLQFCLENFMVGIWSSAREYNVKNLVDYVFGDAKERLAFSWHQSDCTDVGLKAPGNEWKPLFMKELSKLWRKEKVDLPWSEGDYGPSNTLLVDDTPYKAVLNPPNTAIFPRSYTARDHGDNFLGGALRNYLEGIRYATSVQTYVENNPFGEPSITPESPLWSHVSKVLLKVQNVWNKASDKIDQVLPVEDVHDDISSRGRHRRWRKRRRNEYSDPLQLMNDDTRLLNDFPSEAIELQSSENVVLPTESEVPSEEVGHSCAVEQACMPGKNAKENGMLSGPQEADVEQSEQEELRLESLHVDSGKDDGDGGAFEGAALAMERPQLCTAEETIHNREQADGNVDVKRNVKLIDIHEEQVDEVDAHRNEGQKGGGHSGVSPLKFHWMQVEDKDECKESIALRDEDVVHTTDNFEGRHDHLNQSSRDKRRRFHGDSLESHHKRKHHNRGSIDYSQSWKRQGGSYQDNCTNDKGYGQYWKERRGGSFQDRNRDSIGCGQSWKRARGFHQRGASNTRPFNGRDQRRHLHNGEHSIYEADEVYGSRGTSLKRYARHGDRPIDTAPDWGKSGLSNSRARGNAGLDNNFAAPPYRSSGDFHARAPNLSPFGHVQGPAPSNDQWHRGFEPRVPYVSSSIRPERTEDMNKKGRRFNFGKREGEPYRDAEALSQSYRRGGGASRLPYEHSGASGQWHHTPNERRRQQGWSPRGFSRNREGW